MKARTLSVPIAEEALVRLEAGEAVAISGDILVARDAAHRRLFETLQAGKTLPVNLRCSLIYYMGPTPAPRGSVIGSCGPTTSARMDRYTPALLAGGVKATMGKGDRSPGIIEACRRYSAVYLVTYGGCGAYLRRFVVSSRVVAYADLGPEALLQLTVRGFPAIVGIDTAGRNFYRLAK